MEADTHEVLQAAAGLCAEDEGRELREYGPMPPCLKLSPLFPPLKPEEYLMMERDRGKCKFICL